jgi:glycosyltransferase involved in cell wall biosynthesis
MDISVVVPLYNEAESLPELTGWIHKVMESNRFSYEIILIDDGSNDDSWEVVEKLSLQNPAIKAIKFRRNYGKSAALNMGFEASTGQVIITMDADLQDNPEEIPELYRMITEQKLDVVSGWKRKRRDPISKRWPSKIYNFTIRCISGIKLHDFNCGLKAYNHRVVKSIEVYGDMHRYIPVLAKNAGYRKIGEKVVQHQARKFGYSKFGFGRAKGMLDIVTIMFISKFGKKPMQFFGLWGTLMFTAGISIAIYLAYGKYFMAEYKMTDRPLFYFGLLAMILGTQLFTAGFLGELISRSSHDRNHYLIEKKLNVQ